MAVMILDGKALASERQKAVREGVLQCGVTPCLATIQVGQDPGSQLYVRMKHRACEDVGISSVGVELPDTATTDAVVGKIRELNRDPSVDGILVQLPLPSQIATDDVIDTVDPEKDVDGFCPKSLGLLMSRRPVFVPCTPKGIMTLLLAYNIPVSGRTAVVIGRSIEVGRPLAALLLNADATVTLCHSRTRDLARHTAGADILVTAVGKAGFVRPSMVRPGATVIDVGISHLNGKVVGDVDFATVKDVAGAITPVPGGVGPMTIASLLENTLLAATMRRCTGV
jgi:methylenetetrahydrofolate dehydrogenase (NADP+)/methenyltetrahydrofolate cyclohydrolase